MAIIPLLFPGQADRRGGHGDDHRRADRDAAGPLLGGWILTHFAWGSIS